MGGHILDRFNGFFSNLLLFWYSYILLHFNVTSSLNRRVDWWRLSAVNFVSVQRFDLLRCWMYWRHLYLPYAMDFHDVDVTANSNSRGSAAPEEVICRASILSMQTKFIMSTGTTSYHWNIELFTSNHALLMHGTHGWRYLVFPAALLILMHGIKHIQVMHLAK